MRCVRENDICMRVRVTYGGFVHLGFLTCAFKVQLTTTEHTQPAASQRANARVTLMNYSS